MQSWENTPRAHYSPTHNTEIMASWLPQDSTQMPTDNSIYEPSANLNRCDLYYLIVRIILGGCIAVLGLMGNGLTIMVMRGDRKKSATVLALFYLAIVDLLVLMEYGLMTVSVPLLQLQGMDLLALKLQMYYIAYLMPIGQICNLISVFLTVIVTWQRYISVCIPHKAKSYGSIGVVNIQVSCALVSSLLFHLPMFFEGHVVSDYPLPGQTAIVTNSFAKTKAYTVFYSIVAWQTVTYILPIGALCYMTLGLIRALRQSTMKRQNTVSISQRAKEEMTLSLIVVVVISIICQSFAPIRRILMGVYAQYGSSIQCGGPLFYFGPFELVSILVNSSSNFVIFVLCARGFRRKLVRYCRTRRCEVDPALDEDMAHTHSYQLDSFQTQGVGTTN